MLRFDWKSRPWRAHRRVGRCTAPPVRQATLATEPDAPGPAHDQVLQSAIYLGPSCCNIVGAGATDNVFPGVHVAGIALITGDSPREGLWRYLLEIMAVEGLPAPELIAATELGRMPLAESSRAVIVVPSLSLAGPSVAALLEYLRAGGSLLLLRPCAGLGSGLGLQPAREVDSNLLRDAYLELDHSHPLTAPVPKDIPYLQYHGQADAYMPDSQSTAARVYWGGSSMPYPKPWTRSWSLPVIPQSPSQR